METRPQTWHLSQGRKLRSGMLTAQLRVSSTSVNTLIVGRVPTTISWKREGEKKTKILRSRAGCPRCRGSEACSQIIIMKKKNLCQSERQKNGIIEWKCRRASHYTCGSYHYLSVVCSTYIPPQPLFFVLDIIHYISISSHLIGSAERRGGSDCARKTDVNSLAFSSGVHPLNCL